jgi:hypothetical protein
MAGGLLVVCGVENLQTCGGFAELRTYFSSPSRLVSSHLVSSLSRRWGKQRAVLQRELKIISRARLHLHHPVIGSDFDILVQALLLLVLWNYRISDPFSLPNERCVHGPIVAATAMAVACASGSRHSGTVPDLMVINRWAFLSFDLSG